jgi:ATP-binding cassette subfamily B protein
MARLKPVQRLKPGQRRFAPEVVQTSNMDCGPAALKCLLDGFGAPVSYERLREACQTDIDGASIDVIEDLANGLGVAAEQSLLPLDHAFCNQASSLPAMVVTRRPDGSNHFIVIWSRHGQMFQVMDPAAGRRWVRQDQLLPQIYQHQGSVPASAWCDWARSDAFLQLLHQSLKDFTGSAVAAEVIVAQALAAPRWFGLAALDAILRLTRSLVQSGGIRRGKAAEELIISLFDATLEQEQDMFAIVPQAYWSVAPDLESADTQVEHLVVTGAVLLQVRRRDQAAPQVASAVERHRRALAEPSVSPLATLWSMLKEDGVLAPLALSGAMVLAAGAVILQLVLFRALIDISQVLQLGLQRLSGLVLLGVVVNLIMMVEIPIVMETQRLGRRLELRLRMALATKLPRLNDRFFQSRSVSDMAERGHNLHQSRLAPGLAVHLIQALFSLIFTVAAIAWLSPQNLPLSLAIAVAGIALPLLSQPLLGERDLTVRTHLAALNTVLLDALIGLVPIRTHGAQRAMSAVHEGLVTQWARAGRRLIGLSTALGLVQSVLCTGLAALALYLHFASVGALSGSDLLLVYWTLRLPAIAGELSHLAMQYPAQRNVLSRMIEPLNAPEAGVSALSEQEQQPPAPASLRLQQAASLELSQVTVLAGGRPILRDLDLKIRPAEHVAVVGASGAGKSSLLGVVLGWNSPASGTVRVDGRPLVAETLAELRGATAWVDPSVRLWNRSFLDNLSYAAGELNPASLDQVLEAAQLRRMLHKLPDGLQSLLGEGGARLSGGEGQRVRLGRALMQTDVRLVLLDEPFRGLDRSQRTRLMRETRHWWRGATLLCVSHDLSETLAFDRVVVVEDGCIVEQGPPQQLAYAQGPYQALLEAEARLDKALWGDTRWRRIVMGDGAIVSDDSHQGHSKVTALEGRGLSGKLKFLRTADQEISHHGQ